MTIRKAIVEDLDKILNLFVKSIEGSCASDYTPAQRDVWTASVHDKEKWVKRIDNQYFLVAEIGDDMAGFASLDNRNYIDLMFVNPTFQGRGVAKSLLQNLLEHSNEAKITVHASITAEPFFERNGFKLVKENRFKLRGVDIINYEMQFFVG